MSLWFGYANASKKELSGLQGDFGRKRILGVLNARFCSYTLMTEKSFTITESFLAVMEPSGMEQIIAK